MLEDLNIRVRELLVKVDLIDVKLEYILAYIKQREGELNPTCKPVVGAVEQYVCKRNKERVEHDREREIDEAYYRA